MEEIALLAMKVVLESPPKAQFSAILLEGQEYVEVDNKFTQQYHSELGDTWYVLNNQGSYHKLVYNKNHHNSLIKDGWESLKTFYGLAESFELVFSYYGHFCFAISDIKQITCGTQIPAFHSRSICSRETSYFDITCPHLAVCKNKLRI